MCGVCGSMLSNWHVFVDSDLPLLALNQSVPFTVNDANEWVCCDWLCTRFTLTLFSVHYFVVTLIVPKDITRWLFSNTISALSNLLYADKFKKLLVILICLFIHIVSHCHFWLNVSSFALWSDCNLPSELSGVVLQPFLVHSCEYFARLSLCKFTWFASKIVKPI